MAVKQREREAGGGPAGPGGIAESTYAELERALREAYEVVKSGRTLVFVEPASIELGDLLVKVYAESYWSDTIFEVFKRGHPELLCRVELFLRNGEPSSVYMDCEKLEELASRCARGRGCVLSWEEARTAFRLAVWAASRLAGLAGIPAKVEGAGLVEAHDTWDGKPRVFPCLQVSANGKSYSVCVWARLRRDPDGGWEARSVLRLVPIGEAHIKMVEALAELEKMVDEYKRNREREYAERIHVSEHRGKFLKLEEFVLRRADGTEEVLLRPWLFKLGYIREDFAVVECSGDCPEGSDGELADAVRKELEEALGKVVQAVRRYMETGDPRLTTFAYITLEALRKAGLVSDER